MKYNFRKIHQKLRNLNGKNTKKVPSVQQKNKLNSIFLFIVRPLLVMIEYDFRPAYIIFGQNDIT